MGSPFFGLTSEYRTSLFTQIHDLVHHGGGGFLHSEVYNMPVWLRTFHIQKINEYNQKHNKKIEEQQNKAKGVHNAGVARPNIDPSSTYNF